jgi:hypothetical protein
MHGESTASVCDDEIGGRSNEEAERHQPKPQLAMPVAAHPVTDLPDDLEGRAYRYCVKGEFERSVALWRANPTISTVVRLRLRR